MCLYRFIHCKIYTTLEWDADSGRGFRGEQCPLKLSVLSTHFCCEPKFALKHGVYYFF